MSRSTSWMKNDSILLRPSTQSGSTTCTERKTLRSVRSVIWFARASRRQQKNRGGVAVTNGYDADAELGFRDDEIAVVIRAAG